MKVHTKTVSAGTSHCLKPVYTYEDAEFGTIVQTGVPSGAPAARPQYLTVYFKKKTHQ
jgi:hypothetical protein